MKIKLIVLIGAQLVFPFFVKEAIAMHKKIVVVIVTGIFLFLSGVVQAQVTGMTVAVDGMACPFCAFGVEKRLKKVKGGGNSCC